MPETLECFSDPEAVVGLSAVLSGIEDESRFMLVPPGRQITASFQEDIVTHC